MIILYAANKYDIKGLKLLCEETMIEKLNTKSAIQYLIEADKCNCSILNEIINYIIVFAKDLVDAPEFESLPETHPNLMYKITKAIINKDKSR